MNGLQGFCVPTAERNLQLIAEPAKQIPNTSLLQGGTI